MRRPLAFLAGATLFAAGAHATETRAAADEFNYTEPTLAPPPAPASAQGQAKPLPPITRYADADRDGRVTRAEAEEADPVLAQNFDRYDLDRNDALDRGEFARLEAESRQRQAAASLPSPAPSRARAEPLGEPAPTPPRGESLNRSGPGRAGHETEGS